MRSVKSTKSVRSERSVKATFEPYVEEYVELGELIVNALRQYECPIDVYVQKIADKSGKKFSPIKAATRISSFKSVKGEKENLGFELISDNPLTIYMFYDINDRLEEILINKYKDQVIPRMVIQVLGLYIQNLTKLTKLTIKDCYGDRYTILELNNILVTSTTITDICLDSTFLHEGNFDVLLHQATSLQNLSLKSCKINDEVCNRIATRLHFLQPAETTLLTLNLSSNRITDLGVTTIAEALRSNRHLRYLNLADNHITDCGARHMFDVLKEFPLTYDEVINKKRMYYQYLNNKRAINNKSILEFENKETDNIATSRRSVRKPTRNKDRRCEKKSLVLNDSFVNLKMDFIASNFMGPFDHPFNMSQVIIKDGYSYCKGNMVLCHINFAYNYLTMSSLQKLLEVIKYQETHKNTELTGLVRVVIEGNNLPRNCKELECISNIIDKAAPKVTVNKKRQSKH